MIKIKPIIICAASAFVLSFFIALLSKTGVPVSLLKAFIFAVVFGGIAAGIQIVYENFLSEGSAVAVDVSQQKSVGGKVDLVVSEEDLPDDGETPTFALDSTRHVLTSKDVGLPKTASPQPKSAASEGAITAAEQNAALEAAEKVRAQKTAENIVANAVAEKAAAKEAPQPKKEVGEFVPLDLTEQKPAPSTPAPSAVPELDELPDFGVDSTDDGVKKKSDDDVIEDSDFAEEGNPPPKRPADFPDGQVADSKDASLMALAIQTVLKKDE